MARVQEENHAAAGNNQGATAIADAGTLARCGYLLMALSVMVYWADLTEEKAPALCALLLLQFGVMFLFLAMLAPAKLKTT